MTFFIVWAILLVMFLMAAVRRGYQNRDRVKRVNNRIKSLEIKVNQLWEKIK